MVTRLAHVFGFHRRLLTAELIGVGVLTILALVLRLHHLDWALPYTYEEATPLHVAWDMWGWDRNRSVDLNPAFFHYPSLTFYVHFAVQGLLYVAMQLTGAMESLADWRIMYLVDPSPLFLAARLTNVIFGVATAFVVYRIAKAMAGFIPGLLAYALIAINPFHIARSQMVEVDVPLTFFCSLALYGCCRISFAGQRRDYIVSGIALGLATSSKYTGMLLVAPLVIAHILAISRRSGRTRLRNAELGRLAMTIGIALLAFAVTSPYVVLDARASIADILAEREHMAIGHFGADDRPAWLFYARALAGNVLNLPVAALSLLGMFRFAIRRHQSAAIVLSTFVLVYLVMISTWSMKVERYLLPMLPPLLAFAGAGARVSAEWISSRASATVARGGMLLLLVLLLAADAARFVRSVAAYQTDARTDAVAWLQSNAPDGSYIVTEPYGPDLIGPSQLMPYDPRFRNRILQRLGSKRIFAVQTIPMFQTHAEWSAPFYSLDLYPNADFFIKSSGVASRYQRDGDLFSQHLAFYQSLDRNLEKVREFTSNRPDGLHLTIYRRRRFDSPFATRSNVAPPPALPIARGKAPGDSAARFYYELGSNYEFYRRPLDASLSYRNALDWGMDDSGLFYQCVLGEARCLTQLGHTEQAISFLQAVAESSKEPLRGSLTKVARQLSESLSRGQRQP